MYICISEDGVATHSRVCVIGACVCVWHEATVCVCGGEGGAFALKVALATVVRPNSATKERKRKENRKEGEVGARGNSLEVSDLPEGRADEKERLGDGPPHDSAVGRLTCVSKRGLSSLFVSGPIHTHTHTHKNT